MPVQISFPPDLPVSDRRADIEAAIHDHQVVIVAGATGSGKTTQLPKMALALGRERIAHTQPRRIAARAVAERIAEELQVELGREVGYRVRFTDQTSAASLITVMTDGILLNAIHRDPQLRAFDTIIIDEAHERSLNIDFLLGYLKRILPTRPDLKVIITSATIDPESFSAHFDGAPIIEVSGRTFPIEVRYRSLVAEKMTSDDPDDPDEATGSAPSAEVTDYVDGIIAALDELAREAPGDVLVFLSGENEIRDAHDAISGRIESGAMAGTEVLPLYGRLSSAEQHRVFERSTMPGIRRRVILATNVAETSLTVPGIRYVIDTGLARISRYSPRAKVQRLPIEAISQASANQRSGRCGRTSDGIAIRLYSEEDFAKRAEFTDPEILRTNLASVILQAASLGIADITDFPFIQPPDAKGVRDGVDLLRELGAVVASAHGVPKLTKVGRDIAQLPIEPRFARMVIESRRLRVEREVLAIVAGLAVQDPRERPVEKRPQADTLHARFTDPTSDFLTLVNLWNYLELKRTELSSSAFRRMCKSEFLNYLRVREWADVYRQLTSIAKPMGIRPGAPQVNPDGIHRALLSGLLSHIGIRQDKETSGRPGTKSSSGASAVSKRVSAEYLGSRTAKFVLFPGSALAKKPPAAVMSAELVETSRLFARMNAAIVPEWAEALAGDLCKRTYSEPHWERSQGAAVAYERVTLYGVPIVAKRRFQFAKMDAGYARELFIRHALVDGEWDSPQAFDRSNQALRAELTDLEERTRRRDVLFDDENVFAFYNARIPADVVSTRTFEGWWREAKTVDPDLLTMRREDLLGPAESSPDLDATLFPHEWTWGDHRLALHYRFEPGHVDDGVSVDVPVTLLPSLRPAPFTWHVPGLRTELATALIKTLPKAIRRTVVPAADWAAKALAGMPVHPPADGSEDFLTALASELSRLSFTRIGADDFDIERVPDHLRLTFRVVDHTGKRLGSAPVLSFLQEKFAEHARDALAGVLAGALAGTTAGTQADTAAADVGAGERATGRLRDLDGGRAPSHNSAGLIERDLTTWDFDELPRTIDTAIGANTVRGYPALVPGNVTGGDSGVVPARIRILSTAEQQAAAHPLGVRSLVRAAIPSPAKYVLEHLTQNERLMLAAAPYKNATELIDDAIDAAIDRVLFAMRPDGAIFSKHEFETLRDRVQSQVMDSLFDTVALVVRILGAARDADKSIANTNALAFMAVLTSEKQHLRDLMCERFISRSGLDRLPRLLVYLRAISERVTKMADDPGRDRTAANELDAALTVFAAAGGRVPIPQLTSILDAESLALARRDSPLVRARWALEELRVSLFAQSLGTAEPVSLQRIKKMLA
ncbi:MAG: ATP-dependent RNA helicase HrpA [Microbacteriaceae bacterium]|nr:ATP-dependent RNA helicase HrpA [Microbacteriaceae bacterium]